MPPEEKVETIDWKAVQKRLEAAIKDATTLEITTIVGDINMEEIEGKLKPKLDKAKTMYSKIDLVDGDIVTMIDNAFVKGDLAHMRPDHEKLQESANKIIEDNIKTLKDLANYVKEYIDEGAGGGNP